MAMKKLLLFIILILLISILTVAGILLINFGDKDTAEQEQYEYPLSVGEQTFLISVRSNYSLPPEVSYSGLLKSVQMFFKGERENAYCNITIPNNLIWGELSLYQKGYEVSSSDYIQSSNSTHNSIYFTFDLPASTKDFSIKGTEGVMEASP